MFRLCVASLAATLCLAPAVDADGRTRLGYGRLISNDFFGDGEDRWRSGSGQSSRVWGPQWTGTAPVTFGRLLELRIAAEMITPEKIRKTHPGDRRMAGAVSVGLHSHFQRGQAEFALGGDVVVVGPQNGLDEFQNAFHDLFNIPRATDKVRDAQIGNAINPTAVFEIGQNFELGERTRLRPFVEGRAGNESLLRAGFDLTVGGLGRGELLVRDGVTGHRYRTIQSDWSGFSFVLGADVATVSESAFLPESDSLVLRDTRERVRAGVTFRSETGVTGFYGLTYLGKEFEGQSEGQVIGSVRLRLAF